MTNTSGYTPAPPQAGFYPMLPPQALEGVRTRRMIAVLLDLVVVGGLSALIWLVVTIGTLGLSLLVLPSLPPIVAFFYNGMTMSGRGRGTWGMRALDLQVQTTDGRPAPFLNAAFQGVLFWATWYFTGGLALLTSLFTADKRCLHDILSGLIVVRRPY